MDGKSDGRMFSEEKSSKECEAERIMSISKILWDHVIPIYLEEGAFLHECPDEDCGACQCAPWVDYQIYALSLADAFFPLIPKVTALFCGFFVVPNRDMYKAYLENKLSATPWLLRHQIGIFCARASAVKVTAWLVKKFRTNDWLCPICDTDDDPLFTCCAAGCRAFLDCLFKLADPRISTGSRNTAQKRITAGFRACCYGHHFDLATRIMELCAISPGHALDVLNPNPMYEDPIVNEWLVANFGRQDEQLLLLKIIGAYDNRPQGITIVEIMNIVSPHLKLQQVEAALKQLETAKHILRNSCHKIRCYALYGF